MNINIGMYKYSWDIEKWIQQRIWNTKENQGWSKYGKNIQQPVRKFSGKPYQHVAHIDDGLSGQEDKVDYYPPN